MKFNSILFSIGYEPSQGPLHRQLHYGQTQHKVKDKLQASTGGKDILIHKSKQTIKQMKMMSYNKNMIIKSYITQNIRSMKKNY
jgi:hypothetical protein